MAHRDSVRLGSISRSMRHQRTHLPVAVLLDDEHDFMLIDEVGDLALLSGKARILKASTATPFAARMSSASSIAGAVDP